MSAEFITDQARWQQIIEQLPGFCGKAYYQYYYHRVCELNGEGRPAAIYFKQGQTAIFYPFLLRPVPAILGGNGFFDMQSAYGYGGPAVFGSSEEAIQAFGKAHADWAEKEGIVAEFVRFSPFLDQSLLTPFFKPELNRKTVSIELSGDFASMLCRASGPRQRNYRKAARAGLRYVAMPDIDKIVRIYREAMQRIGADSYYHFSDRYFSALNELPPDSRFYAGILDTDGRLIAGGIFLQDETAAHYHLGASTQKARDLQPDTFMLFEAARHIAASGRKILHLGGGLSLAEDDGLYRFKSGFSKKRHDFYIARKIHRPQKYQEFSAKWQALTGREPQILLHYHEGLEHADI